jgi:hypothetical protein
MENTLAGQRPSPEPASDVKERRGAARQASGILGTCRIVEAPGDQMWTCEIQDISFTGLALVLRRWFGPGTALVVQPFGDPAEAPALVVCVKRARPHGGGFWHHGCRFLKPLNENELRTLLPGQPQSRLARAAAPAKEPQTGATTGPAGLPRRVGTERRRCVRFRNGRTATCRLLGNESEAVAARIDNVSQTGLALRVPRPARRGSILVIAVEGIGGRFARPILARVTNCRAAGAGVWRMGCSFVRPLSGDEVQVLLVPERGD